MSLPEAIARQLRRPTGFLGWVMGRWMNRMNRPSIDWTIGLLDIKPDDHVLEIGFGTGLAIEQAARLACRGRVSGVDLSDDMVRTAAAHNSRAIVEGRVELKSGDAAVLPYAIETFDKVFAINVVYFWQAPIVMLTEIRRVLKIGGSVGLYLVAKEDMERTAFCRTSHFSLLSGEDVATVLAKVGFREVRVETTKEKWRTGICVLGFK